MRTWEACPAANVAAGLQGSRAEDEGFALGGPLTAKVQVNFPMF